MLIAIYFCYRSFQPSNPFKQYAQEEQQQTKYEDESQAGPSTAYGQLHYDYLADDDTHHSPTQAQQQQAFADAVRTPGGITDGGWMVPSESMSGMPAAARDLVSLASSSHGNADNSSSDFNLLHPSNVHPLSANATDFSLGAPSSMGLPVYSASGFDLLSVLGRVANRPHPKIALGPVDLTCAFVVVDVRRYDRPIVYASSTFCALTGACTPAPFSHEIFIFQNF